MLPGAILTVRHVLAVLLPLLSRFAPWTVALLASPLRRCIVTDRVLPCDMMICLRAVRVPSADGTGFQNTLVPTRMMDREHERVPKGKSIWVACWHEAMSVLLRKGSYKRLMPQLNASANMLERVHSQLARNIAQQAQALVGVDGVTVHVQASTAGSQPATDHTSLLIDLQADAKHLSTIEREATTFRLKRFLQQAPLPPDVENPYETVRWALLALCQGQVGATTFVVSATGDDNKQTLVKLTRALLRARWWTGQGWDQAINQ